ncbi:DNA polymerase Y family protein [Corynebacterium sp. 153RC1]|uniref:Y-family DNA polymerase n=1 Tax=unclassified Corynebacterium TaxID=2624378 RepID=UPI00211CDB30|nr:DNA polymerase Y family protein [Corynebacterium sp. 209RC1]MCQ9354195.1 DNA polymerase Y family protein [Corynebacterium sp. 1222RC1]MCQ9356475.1 DNA polymerase Y family protein [Corynebacterium sp. 122RC1]MCQ9358577.1 DNA polymerase Y family protein [Corynebacterium sp. 142RC1]MCQ9361089.1 DNA polymerase Y family protein [Corynebacterium sp. 153RC1]MCQ9363025.1 DNA polymerase Y family protein [Corynebacterium sp. 732RC1]MCQ9364736.1 DNA polymerase Y family protein [Corynebacterium sp. 70
MRTLALWFPDWPVQAARFEKLFESPAVAVVAQHRVVVCDAAARSHGIRRGMRARQAQAIYPPLTLVDANEERDARVFSTIADGLDDVASSVEILRPGLVAVDVRAAANYHGSEDKAASMLVDASSRAGLDSFAGIADDIPTAIIAARASQVVPPGGAQAFLYSQPIGVLAEPALACDPDTVHAFEELGLHTLGALADLDARSIATRFGAAGARCHAIAQARDTRLVAPELTQPELTVTYRPEEAIQRVDEAAFVARQLAAQLHERIARTGLVCSRLTIKAHVGERELSRTWRTTEPLSEHATAQRVRWQLDGWLTTGGQGQLEELTLEPQCAPAPPTELWGSRGEGQQAVAQVQSTLGTDAVLQPFEAGGRGVAERIQFVAYGEHAQSDTRPWAGAIRAPLPASIRHPATKVRLLTADGTDIGLADAALTAAPATLLRGRTAYRVTGWAGPWPVDDAWWRGGEPCVRLQVTGEGDGPRAWLLVWAGQWRVEAEY